MKCLKVFAILLTVAKLLVFAASNGIENYSQMNTKSYVNSPVVAYKQKTTISNGPSK